MTIQRTPSIQFGQHQALSQRCASRHQDRKKVDTLLSAVTSWQEKFETSNKPKSIQDKIKTAEEMLDGIAKLLSDSASKLIEIDPKTKQLMEQHAELLKKRLLLLKHQHGLGTQNIPQSTHQYVRKVSIAEEQLLKNVMNDLLSQDCRVVKSAEKTLRSLGLGDADLTALKQKLNEPQVARLQFSSTSTADLLQGFIEKIVAAHPEDSVIGAVALHEFDASQAIASQIASTLKFGAMAWMNAGALGPDGRPMYTRQVVNDAPISFDHIGESRWASVQKQMAEAGSAMDTVNARIDDFNYRRMLQQNGLI